MQRLTHKPPRGCGTEEFFEPGVWPLREPAALAIFAQAELPASGHARSGQPGADSAGRLRPGQRDQAQTGDRHEPIPSGFPRQW